MRALQFDFNDGNRELTWPHDAASAPLSLTQTLTQSQVRKGCVLSGSVLDADETPMSLLDPGAAKTKRVYIWAYARGELDAQLRMSYEFCLGRGSQYPLAFLGAAQALPGSPAEDSPARQGTLVCHQ